MQTFQHIIEIEEKVYGMEHGGIFFFVGKWWMLCKKTDRLLQCNWALRDTSKRPGKDGILISGSSFSD